MSQHCSRLDVEGVGCVWEFNEHFVIDTEKNFKS